MTSPWTLEREILEQSGRDDLLEGLRFLGMIDPSDTLESLDILSDWRRGGAETYVVHFRLRTKVGLTREYIVKACVALDGGSSLRETLERWLSRRAFLQELGVSTPQLVGTSAATLIEEYIPYDLADALKCQESRQRILHSIAHTAAQLAGAGFMLASAHDWRSRGTDVVIVDFGQDLSEPHMTMSSHSVILSKVLDALSSNRASLSVKELHWLSNEYEAAMRRDSECRIY